MKPSQKQLINCKNILYQWKLEQYASELEIIA